MASVDVVARLERAIADVESAEFAADLVGWTGWLCLRGGDWEDRADADAASAQAIDAARELAAEYGVTEDDPEYERTLEILTWNTEIVSAARAGCERASSDDKVVFHVAPDVALEQARLEQRGRSWARPELHEHLVDAVRATTLVARRVSVESHPAARRGTAARRPRSRSPGGDDSEPEPPLDRPRAAGEVAA